MENEELLLAAVDLVASAATQLITLSVAIIGLCLVLTRWFVPDRSARSYRVLSTALFTFLLSVGLGVATLLNLAGNLATVGGGGLDAVRSGADERSTESTPAPTSAGSLETAPARLARVDGRSISIYEGNVMFVFYLQLASFALGMLILLSFVLLRRPREASPSGAPAEP